MLAGWSAIAAAVLTVTGLFTLLAFFGTGSVLLGRLNDLNTILMVLATVPVALALHPIASRASVPLATGALAADVVGVLLAAGFSALLLMRVMTFAATLTVITVGNGLIGVWLAMTAWRSRLPWCQQSSAGWASRGVPAWQSRRWAFRCSAGSTQ